MNVKETLLQYHYGFIDLETCEARLRGQYMPAEVPEEIKDRAMDRTLTAEERRTMIRAGLSHLLWGVHPEDAPQEFPAVMQALRLYAHNIEDAQQEAPRKVLDMLPEMLAKSERHTRFYLSTITPRKEYT